MFRKFSCTAEVVGFLFVRDDGKHQLDFIQGPFCQPKTRFNSKRIQIFAMLDRCNSVCAAAAACQLNEPDLNVIELTIASMFAFRRGKEKKKTVNICSELRTGNGHICPAK